MSLPASIQTLSAAFSFGILLQAATGALFIYYKAKDAKILQDGRRLVLMLFMLFAALWAQISFINLIVTSTSTSTCQALLVFTTTFDQLARVSIEQFFLWAMSQGTKATTQQYLLQGVLVIRLIVGGVLVGLTRPDAPQFSPVCAAHTSVLPIAIVVLALDFVIIGVSIIRIFSMGIFSDMRVAGKSTIREQSKALIFGVLAYALWTGTSVPMILGVSTLPLIVRTVVPSNGLLILVGVLTMFPGALLSKREDEGTTPEAQSPFMAAPAPNTREVFRENADTTFPISGADSNKAGVFFSQQPTSVGSSASARFSGFSSSNEPTRGFTKLNSNSEVREVVNQVADNSMSKNGPGYRGSSGVFPSIFATPLQSGPQSSLAIPTGTLLRESSSPVPPQVSHQKRSMFWSKAPAKTNIRNLGISNPVMSEDNQNANQLFSKIPTVDLATAAANERERREEAAARARLMEVRLATEPRALGPTNGIRNSTNLKRKVTPGMMDQPLPSIPGSKSSSLSVDDDTASTTSTSLSPGHEEVRRRSPRNSKSFERSIDKPAPKPPLQRKGTIGLPSNPRAGVQRGAIGQEAAQDPTIMLVNDIVYNDPATVNSIMSAAPHTFSHTTRRKTSGNKLEDMQSANLKSSNSILHRPRPYRRDSETDRAIFPSESPLHHQRSKSGPSMLMRKSMLSSAPGSPTNLPPLPPPPTSAMKLRRLLPNDTKSMTFDEKIELLFPAPPGIPTIPNRRSSVPSLPRVPSQFGTIAQLLPKSPADVRDSQMTSKRSTIASYAFLDINEKQGSPGHIQQELGKAVALATQRFSANTYRNIADEVGETWIPGISTGNVDIRNSVHAPTKVYDGRKSAWTEGTSSDESSPRDTRDSATYWGSVHSRAPAVDLPKARQNAHSTFITPRETYDKRDVPSMPPLEYNDGEEIMTVMFDTAETRQPILSIPAPDRLSFALGVNQPQSTSVHETRGGWHRRIGDELPTFSGRTTNTKIRKLPPPTPLLLNNRVNATAVVVQAREPSPMDSPERALQQIQEQLKKMEDPNRASVDSIFRRLPVTGLEQDGDSDKLRLLENLEKEMGQQENQWQQMHNDFDQDSVSAISPATTVLSERSVSRHSSIIVSRTPSFKRERSRLSIRSRKQELTSTKNIQNPGASIWQQRLAEAQVEYLEKAPALLRKGSVNFLSVAKSHQLGSPTPPESVDSGTDMSSDSESESGETLLRDGRWSSSVTKASSPSLWQPAIDPPQAASGRMWNPPYETTSRAELSEPPAKNIRPIPRRNGDILTIRSSTLWTKSQTPEQKRAVTGLWGSRALRPRSIITRRVTQRPQRKSKRLTFLPDIVESPVPLPNKRDTLGIYQFPWGEKSDTAIYQPPFDPSILAGSLVSARLQERSLQLEPDLDEYSASYFDDYDGEEDDSSDMGSESDDDFDETTLWEIASLLQSTNVPSKNSLLPPVRQVEWSEDVIDEHDTKSDFEDGLSQTYSESAQEPTMQLPIQPLSTSKPTSLLWARESSLESVVTGKGLPQPSEGVWTSLLTPTNVPVKSMSHLLSELPMLESSRLWEAQPKYTEPSTPCLMWSDHNSQLLPPVNMIFVPKSAGLWSLVNKRETVSSDGLFTSSGSLKASRTTSQVPAALSMTCKPRPSQLPLASLSSDKLWSGCGGSQSEHHWISESSVRPESPFISSPTSSGESSPVSDTSSIKSTSTKASSIWGSFTSSMPWALKSVKNSTPRSPVDAPKPTLKSTDGQSAKRAASPNAELIKKTKIPAPVSVLASVRESRVLSSKDLFEARLNLETLPIVMAQNIVDSTPPPKEALIHRRKAIVATTAAWKAALAEAIIAGRPKMARSKRTATTADWKAQLEAAISASKPQLLKPEATPAMWRAALEDAVVAGTPILATIESDASVCHPVFFVKNMTSTTADIHPAAIGYCKFSPKPELWHGSVHTKSPASGLLWSKAATVKEVNPAMFASLKEESIRRARVLEPTEMAELNSSSCWTAPKHETSEPNWLFRCSTSPPKTFTWTLGTSKVRSHNNPSLLWSKRDSPVIIKATDALIDAYTLPRKVSNPVSLELPALSSSSLWQKTRDVYTENTWLLATKKEKAMTWSPPTVGSCDIDSHLWSIERMNQRHSHLEMTASSDRSTKKVPNHTSPHLAILESSQLWQPLRVVSSEQHWLQSNLKTMFVQFYTWTPRSELPTQKQTAMWSLTEMRPSPQREDIFSHVLHDLEKKVSAPQITSLPSLQSSSLFQVQQKGSGNQHWLHLTCRTENIPTSSPASSPVSTLWTATPTVSPATQESLLWETSPSIEVSSQASFDNPHSVSWNRAKRELEPVKTIESVEMWRRCTKIPISPKNWLENKVVNKVEFRY